MKCPGCGANLGLEDQFCPYCGTANPHARQHQAEMQNFRHEFEKTRDRVEERANRFAGFAVPLTILGIAVALLIASLVFTMNAYQIGKSIRTKQLAAQGAELRARIENALDERDYGFIEALYTNQDLYLLTSSYGNNQVLKDYDMIFRACEYYEWAEATIADLPGRSGYRFSAERIRETCAKPIGERTSVPPKMTSSILLPRRALVRCSPMTQRIASEMLDFPDPLGPTMAVMSFSKVRRVLSAKDLNPCISSALRYTKNS